jgi:prepilin-type N-terminal cleavage/methylation domain-containing protein
MMKAQKGFTLVEILMVVVIVGMIGPVMLGFLYGSFQLNSRINGQILNQQHARYLLSHLKGELREVQQGAGNQYPIEVCNALDIEYYADLDQDNAIEKVRYYVDGFDLKRTLTNPTEDGDYLLSGSEEKLIMGNVLNDAEHPLFTYYNSSFTGSEAPLSYGNCIEARLVEINVRIDTEIELDPGAFEVRSYVAFRNLKGNL